MNLQTLNTIDSPSALQFFMDCCASRRWAEKMTVARPFKHLGDLKEHARQIWKTLTEADYLQAFAAHPKIGDINSLASKYSHLSGIAEKEQSSIQSAGSDILTRFATLNAKYEKKMGFIFIICASGKSPEEMLMALTERLLNKREKEIALAQEEQLKITLLRLEKLT